MIFDFGFVIPLESEADPLIRLLTQTQEIRQGTRRIVTGKLNNKHISIIISGCGKIKSASATQLLIDAFSAKLYVHYGTAGALDKNLRIGDIVVANEVVEYDVKELFPQKVPAPMHLVDRRYHFFFKNSDTVIINNQIIIGRILSGDEDIVTIQRRNSLFKQYNGLCVDWESAGFALTCSLNVVSGTVMRVISDYAYENTVNEYSTNKDDILANLLSLIRIIIGE